MTNADVLFTTTFHLDHVTKEIIVTDNTDYATLGITTTNVKGILKCTSPVSVFYNNTNYAAWDIAPSTSLDSINTIALPLDSNGDVLQGTYQIQYSIRVIGAITPGDYVNVVTYTFDYSKPEAVISIEHSCLTSSLTVTDETDYDVVMSGVSITPTKYYTMVVTPPPTSTLTPTTVHAVTTTISPIWTRVWTVATTTTVAYVCSDGLVLNDTVTGEDSQDVLCESCLCDLRVCIQNIIDRYTTYLSSKPSEAQRLADVLFNILLEYMQLNNATNCGDTADATIHCNNLVTLVNSITTCCSQTSDAGSQLIVPIVSGTGTSVGGSQILSGSGAPAPALGNDGDWYWDTVAPNNLYNKIAGAWVFQFATKGATGSTGSNNVTILYNDIADAGTAADLVELDLKTYTLGAGSLSTDGSYLDIDVSFTIAAGSLDPLNNGILSLVKIYLGATNIATCNINYSYTYRTGRFRLRVIRKTATTQTVKMELILSGATSEAKLYYKRSSITENLAIANILRVTGQNGVALLNGVIVNDFFINQFIK